MSSKHELQQQQQLLNGISFAENQKQQIPIYDKYTLITSSKNIENNKNNNQSNSISLQLNSCLHQQQENQKINLTKIKKKKKKLLSSYQQLEYSNNIQSENINSNLESIIPNYSLNNFDEYCLKSKISGKMKKQQDCAHKFKNILILQQYGILQQQKKQLKLYIKELKSIIQSLLKDKKIILQKLNQVNKNYEEVQKQRDQIFRMIEELKQQIRIEKYNSPNYEERIHQNDLPVTIKTYDNVTTRSNNNFNLSNVQYINTFSHSIEEITILRIIEEESQCRRCLEIDVPSIENWIKLIYYFSSKINNIIEISSNQYQFHEDLVYNTAQGHLLRQQIFIMNTKLDTIAQMMKKIKRRKKSDENNTMQALRKFMQNIMHLDKYIKVINQNHHQLERIEMLWMLTYIGIIINSQNKSNEQELITSTSKFWKQINLLKMKTKFKNNKIIQNFENFEKLVQEMIFQIINLLL